MVPGDTAAPSASRAWPDGTTVPGLFFWMTLCSPEGQGDRVRNRYADSPSSLLGCAMAAAQQASCGTC